MFFVSGITTTAPVTFGNQLQEKVYNTLAELDISFERVDSDPALTMTDCLHIDAALDMKTVKTLFLTNRQKTEFYLVVTSADKPFSTKDFGSALSVARVSFASAELLENMLGTKPGAATIFGLLLDGEKKVQLIVDKDVLDQQYFGCSDGTSTCYLRIGMSAIFNVFLPAIGRIPQLVVF